MFVFFVTMFMVLRPCAPSLIVPGHTSYTYTMPGDIMLGVLQNVLNPGKDHDQMCDQTSYNEYALHQCEGVLYALNEINYDQDILPNITLGIVCMDTCSEPVVALGKAVYMVPDVQKCPANSTSGTSSLTQPKHYEVVGVIGSGMSRIAVVVSSFFQVFQLPILGTFETSDELSDKSRYKYFLRLAPSDRYQAEVFGDIIKYFGWSYVGLVYSEGPYGEHGAKGVRKMANIHGFCLAYSHEILLEKTPSEVEEVKELLSTYANARVVVWFVDYDIAQRIFNKLEGSFEEDHIFLMSDSMGVLASTYPRLCHGGIIPFLITPEMPGYSAYAQKSFSSPRQQDDDYKYWLDVIYRTKHNCSWYSGTCDNMTADPSWASNERVASMFYDATHVFAKALHDLILVNCPEVFTQGEYNNSCIKGPQLLRHLKALTMEGVTGKITFDKNGDRLAKYRLFHFYNDENGIQHSVSLGIWDKELDSMKLNHTVLQWGHLRKNRKLKHTVLNQTVIPMSFCSSDCEAKQYKILLNPPCCWECRWCRSNERLDRNKSTCVACPVYTWPYELTALTCVDITPVYIQWSDTASVILLVLAAVGTTISTTFFFIIWKNRNTKLIKATNKEQSFLILLSSTLAFVSILAFVCKPTQASCFVREVGFHIVVCLLYSTLLVKTFRVHCIFSSGKKGKKSSTLVTLKAQRTLTCFTILIQILLLVGVKVSYPTEVILRMPVVTAPSVELSCSHHTLSFLVPVSYNVVMILLCSGLGYSARKLPDNYNESGFIFVSVATTLFAWAVFLPTYFTASTSGHQTLILASCLIINAYVTMTCLFAPKVYALYCVEESDIKFTTMTQSTGVTQDTSN